MPSLDWPSCSIALDCACLTFTSHYNQVLDAASLTDVPTDFIRDVLLLLNDRDTAVIACVCHAWHGLSRERFPHLVKARWRFGTDPRWQEMRANHQWAALYSARAQVPSPLVSS